MHRRWTSGRGSGQGSSRRDAGPGGRRRGSPRRPDRGRPRGQPAGRGGAGRGGSPGRRRDHQGPRGSWPVSEGAPARGGELGARVPRAHWRGSQHMSGLLVVELRRFLVRRLVRAVAVLVMVGIVIAGIATLAKSHRSNAGALEAQARVKHDRIVAECISGRFGPPTDALPPGQSREEFCRSVVTSEPNDPRFHLMSLVDVFKGTTVPLVLLAWVLSASFIGAEWHAGTVTTLLTWEPRRIRVLVAKVAVCMA